MASRALWLKLLGLSSGAAAGVLVYGAVKHPSSDRGLVVRVCVRVPPRATACDQQLRWPRGVPALLLCASLGMGKRSWNFRA